VTLIAVCLCCCCCCCCCRHWHHTHAAGATAGQTCKHAERPLHWFWITHTFAAVLPSNLSGSKATTGCCALPPYSSQPVLRAPQYCHALCHAVLCCDAQVADHILGNPADTTKVSLVFANVSEGDILLKVGGDSLQAVSTASTLPKPLMRHNQC
jgi:hypothetical protein